jgi:methylmalonyl-CoA mutase N-terminal domain/subunit
LALPSEKSAQIALRTQQIIAFESAVADCVDPLGGAYFLETLTNQVEEKVMEYLNKIEDLGGMGRAIEAGFVQKEIQDSAYHYQKQVEEKEQIIVSLNEFINTDEKIHFNLYSPPEEVEKSQQERLIKVKEERSEERIKKRLRTLKLAAQKGQNVFPPILGAVRELATLGEITSTLKEVYGNYQENITI